MRIEYIDAMSQTLLVGKKFEEVDVLVNNFVNQIDPSNSYRYLTLGNYYYLLQKYDLAFPQYIKAQEYGWTFKVIDHMTFDQLSDALAHLNKKTPRAPRPQYERDRAWREYIRDVAADSHFNS